METSKYVLILFLFMLFGCQHSEESQQVKQPSVAEKIEKLPPIPVPDLSDPIFTEKNEFEWADSVLKNMSIRQKAAQLIFPRTNATYVSRDHRSWIRIRKLIEQDEIGGLVVFQGDVFEQATMLNEFQSYSNLPLWIMQDTENGLAMRIRNATLFPHIMTLGAIDDTVLTRKYATVIALENRATGVHHALAPVVDINNNPLNPVINIRAFSESVDIVSRHGLAYMRGIQNGGNIPTAKHFPGHGDTGTDSHIDLPVLPYTLERLNRLELKPFDVLISNNIPSVMIGHLAIPKISGDNIPATLSKIILDELLFKRYDYKGLVVSDAMEMGAIVKNYGNSKAVIMGIQAGMDAIILPLGEETVIDAIVEAVSSGELSEERLNVSVRKLLFLKEKFNLHKNRLIDINYVRNIVASTNHTALAEEVATRSLTLIKNEQQLVPFSTGKIGRRVLALLLSDFQDQAVTDLFVRTLRQETGKNIETILLDKRSNALDYEIASKRISAYDQIMIVSFSTVSSGRGKISLEPPIRKYLEEKKSELKNKKVISIALGNPYTLNDLSFSKSLIATYSMSEMSQVGVIKALNGNIPFEGKLPINLTEFPLGVGINTRKIFKEQEKPCIVENYHFKSVEIAVDEAIAERVSPGFAVAVIQKDQLEFQKGFGRQTYSDSSAAITCSTIYDLASLTKVLATTLSIMKLYEDKLVQLNDPISKYFPNQIPPDKAEITIRHLLTHTSGFESWRPFYKQGIATKEAIISTILNSKLKYTVGDSSIYSDWNFILLGEIVNSASGRNLNTYVTDEIYKKLNLNLTMFLPHDSLKSYIAPTEIDTIWRKTLIHGKVHDEASELLGGVSGHAGLFSSISDVSIIMKLLLNKGILSGKRIFKKETVELFTMNQKLKGNRALGWDTRSSVGYSSTGKEFGSRTYGHLGFTGTSFWIDPDKEIGVIILANRVHPTRENRKISQFRPVIHDLIMTTLTKTAN